MKRFLTIMLFALTAAAYAQDNNYAAGQEVVLVIPQQGATANQTVPVIEIGGLRLNVSQASSAQARMAIQQMYYNQGGCRLIQQDASVRKFSVRITGSCMSSSAYSNNYSGNYNQYNYYGNYSQPAPQLCQNGSQFAIQTIAPAAVGQNSAQDSQADVDASSSNSERGSAESENESVTNAPSTSATGL